MYDEYSLRDDALRLAIEYGRQLPAPHAPTSAEQVLDVAETFLGFLSGDELDDPDADLGIALTLSDGEEIQLGFTVAKAIELVDLLLEAVRDVNEATD